MRVYIKFYVVNPVLLTLIRFQGHNSISNIKLKLIFYHHVLFSDLVLTACDFYIETEKAGN